MRVSDLRSAAGGLVFLLAGAATAVADTANEAFVRAVRSIQLAEATSSKQEELTHLEDAVQTFDLIIQDFPSSDLAVTLITGQNIGTVDPAAIRERYAALSDEVSKEEAARIARETEEEAARVAHEAKEQAAQQAADKLLTCAQDESCLKGWLDNTTGAEAERLWIGTLMLNGDYNREVRAAIGEILEGQLPTDRKIRQIISGFSILVVGGANPETIAHDLDSSLAELGLSSSERWQLAGKEVLAATFRFAQPERSRAFFQAAAKEGFVNDSDAALNQAMQDQFGIGWDIFEDYDNRFSEGPGDWRSLAMLTASYARLDPDGADIIAQKYANNLSEVVPFIEIQRALNARAAEEITAVVKKALLEERTRESLFYLIPTLKETSRETRRTVSAAIADHAVRANDVDMEEIYLILFDLSRD